jgi:hypothetical protein
VHVVHKTKTKRTKQKQNLVKRPRFQLTIHVELLFVNSASSSTLDNDNNCTKNIANCDIACAASAAAAMASCAARREHLIVYTPITENDSSRRKPF